MHFLPGVYVTCEVCKGKRYGRETPEVRYKGLNIAEALDLFGEQARELFAAHPRTAHILDTLIAVGLGTIRLGQPATTLSGGEAQRIRLSRELARRATGSTLYILDELTTYLHFEDVKTADWVIDLGPEGGEVGGRIVAQGTPKTSPPSRPASQAPASSAASWTTGSPGCGPAPSGPSAWWPSPPRAAACVNPARPNRPLVAAEPDGALGAGGHCDRRRGVAASPRRIPRVGRCVRLRREHVERLSVAGRGQLDERALAGLPSAGPDDRRHNPEPGTQRVTELTWELLHAVNDGHSRREQPMPVERSFCEPVEAHARVVGGPNPWPTRAAAGRPERCGRLYR